MKMSDIKQSGTDEEKYLASNRVLIEMMMSSPAARIQTRTLFGSSPRQIPMPHNLRFRKENLQIPEKVNESRFLLSCHGVARFALLIEPLPHSRCR